MFFHSFYSHWISRNEMKEKFHHIPKGHSRRELREILILFFSILLTPFIYTNCYWESLWLSMWKLSGLTCLADTPRTRAFQQFIFARTSFWVSEVKHKCASIFPFFLLSIFLSLSNVVASSSYILPKRANQTFGVKDLSLIYREVSCYHRNEN